MLKKGNCLIDLNISVSNMRFTDKKFSLEWLQSNKFLSKHRIKLKIKSARTKRVIDF